MKVVAFRALLFAKLPRRGQLVEKPLYIYSGSPSGLKKPPLQCFGLDV
jgi:hypothetical protein